MSKYLAQRFTHHERVTVHPRSELSAVEGTSRLSSLTWRDHALERDVQLDAAGLFLMIGAAPGTTWLHEVGVELDDKGFVVTLDGFATSVPGVFAVGDVRAGSIKRVASAVGGALVAATPQYPMLFFNLACCESLCGRTSDALDHLRHAIEMSEEFRASAKADSDLDPIRDEPAFKQLIND